MKCRECGEEGDGNYCARCGAPLGSGGDEQCSGCGADLPADSHFCPECGEPVRGRPEKEPTDYLPWVLSGLALVAFAVGITLLVQEQSSPRQPGAPPTGGVIESGTPDDADRPGGVAPGEGASDDAGARSGGTGSSPGGVDSGAGEGPGGDAMPSEQELAEMSPREAADRLFNRTMRLRAAGDAEDRAPFFARMGVRAYRRVPPAGVDADVRFHVGLLELVRDRPEAAAAASDTILSETPGHLLGLLLAARAAEARGDEGAARRWRDSLRAAAEGTSLDARPEYRAHDSMLEEALEEAPGETPGEGDG